MDLRLRLPVTTETIKADMNISYTDRQETIKSKNKFVLQMSCLEFHYDYENLVGSKANVFFPST